MMRIGLMGCGAVADYGHIPAILQTPGLSLIAVFDPNEARAKEAAAKHGIAQSFSNQKAFLDSGLDAVVVSSIATVARRVSGRRLLGSEG